MKDIIINNNKSVDKNQRRNASIKSKLQPVKYKELSAEEPGVSQTKPSAKEGEKFNWLKHKSNQQQTPRVGRQQEKLEPKNNNARSKHNERSRFRSQMHHLMHQFNKSNTEQRQANNIQMTPTNPNRAEQVKKLEEQIQ